MLIETTVIRDTNGDSRVAEKVPTITEFTQANNNHRDEVSSMMSSIALEIANRGKKHDHTKSMEPCASLFYRDLCDAINGRMAFEDGDWLKMHYARERHHLNYSCPEDVNLIDVLEMICDCVCAGMARSGQVREVEISNDILVKAFNNTVKLCEESVTLEDWKNGNGTVAKAKP